MYLYFRVWPFDSTRTRCRSVCVCVCVCVCRTVEGAHLTCALIRGPDLLHLVSQQPCALLSLQGQRQDSERGRTSCGPHIKILLLKRKQRFSDTGFFRCAWACSAHLSALVVPVGPVDHDPQHARLDHHVHGQRPPVRCNRERWERHYSARHNLRPICSARATERLVQKG